MGHPKDFGGSRAGKGARREKAGRRGAGMGVSAEWPPLPAPPLLPAPGPPSSPPSPPPSSPPPPSPPPAPPPERMAATRVGAPAALPVSDQPQGTAGDPGDPPRGSPSPGWGHPYLGRESLRARSARAPGSRASPGLPRRRARGPHLPSSAAEVSQEGPDRASPPHLCPGAAGTWVRL